ncbi:unnamed protein product [Nippostrongylus brasiliensis]|uniref:Myelin basic protein n=1 Tax=Nippostrongylus brasiliensis TaxID=27835 RepID=A0A0N4XN51_NIPBR|nr:unnamed protein product [Nippostrongylus brasiliensis]
MPYHRVGRYNQQQTKKIKSAIGLGLLKSHTADIGKTFGPEEEHPDPNERENKGESRVMRIFAKKDRGEKRDRSEKSQSRLGSSDSDEDDDDDPAAAANLEYAKPDPNFGSNAFVETDKPQTWNVSNSGSYGAAYPNLTALNALPSRTDDRVKSR